MLNLVVLAWLIRFWIDSPQLPENFVSVNFSPMKLSQLQAATERARVTERSAEGKLHAASVRTKAAKRRLRLAKDQLKKLRKEIKEARKLFRVTAEEKRALRKTFERAAETADGLAAKLVKATKKLIGSRTPGGRKALHKPAAKRPKPKRRRGRQPVVTAIPSSETVRELQAAP